MHSVAILEPAESWRGWLHATAARAPGASVLRYDSGQAMLAALSWVRPDVIVTSFRLPHVDGYAWLCSLRQNVYGRSARLIATVGATDHSGMSLARLGGADRVFRKVVDSEGLQTELAWRFSASRSDAGPLAMQPLLPEERQPLFDLHSAAEPMLGDALKCRTAVFDFLSELMRHVVGLPMLYAMPTHLAASALLRFAMSCRAVGALRAAHYTELMHASLREGGLHRTLIGECTSVMAETRSEMIAWLLEWPHSAR